ncbi:MAG: TRAP transporter small permease, partial [Burkholderiales bacterium]|nr:TRAP transporter small permease [Burkholderiales bacterium]
MHAASTFDDNPPQGAVAAWAAGAQRQLGRLLGIPVALLVAAEIAVLLAGVVARYVFHRPLIWSDEVASMLFLWLAMLGAAIAFQRGEHMRMTAVVGKLDPARRAFLDLVATAAALAFLVLILPHAWNYAVEQAVMRTPALDLQDSWRAAGMAVGFGAMALLALLRLAAVGRPRQVAAALGLVVGIIAIMALLQPLWHQLGNANLVVFFVVVVAGAVFAGVPIAFAFGLATLGYVMLTTQTPTIIVVGRMDEG